MAKGKGFRGRPIRNHQMIGAGKKFKAVRNKSGKINWRKSVRPKGKLTPKSFVKSVKRSKPVATKGNFRTSYKPAQPARKAKQAPVKSNNTRLKGLQRMRSQAAKSTPSPKIQQKSRKPVKVMRKGR